MKHINDHEGYAAALDLLQRLTDERDRLAKEQAGLIEQLSFANQSAAPTPDSLDRARALLNGEALPPNRAGAIDALRERELEIRTRLEVLNAALRQQPEAVERQREAARAAALATREKEVAAVRARMAEAIRKLQAAIEAEDAIISGLVAGGFGLQEPSTTAPSWLNRELFRELEAA